MFTAHEWEAFLIPGTPFVMGDNGVGALGEELAWT
jgi:hypothetical protein